MHFYLFSHMTLFSGRWRGVVRINPGRCRWAELNCPFRAPRCQRSIIIPLCVKTFDMGIHVFIFAYVIGCLCIVFITKRLNGIQMSEFRIQMSEFRIQNSEFRIQMSEFRCQISDFRPLTSDL